MSRDIFDEPSLQNCLAFSALAHYVLGEGGAHYAAIHHSMSKQLKSSSPHIKKVQSDAYKTSLLLDIHMDGIERCGQQRHRYHHNHHHYHHHPSLS